MPYITPHKHPQFGIAAFVLWLAAVHPCPGDTTIVESVSMPPDSHSKTQDTFVPIPAPKTARANSEWFACEPSERWGTWIGDGKAEFYLDTIKENGETFKACRTRINKETEAYTRGCFTRMLIDTPQGYVYRVYTHYKASGGAKTISLRPIFRPPVGDPTYSGRSMPLSTEWTTYRTPWLAPPAADSRMDVEVLYGQLNPGDDHLDCWFRTFQVERIPVTLRHPADNATLQTRSPVFSWDVARVDLLQVSTSPDFPDAATRTVTREMIPVAAWRFDEPFELGTYYWRIGFNGGDGTFWIGPNRFELTPLPEGQWGFDFGPKTSPVDPDAHGIDESGLPHLSGNGALRGYSEPDELYRRFEFRDDKTTWRGDDGKTYYYNRKLTLNAAITRDFIEGEGPHRFTVDVADGAYRVLIISGHPNESTTGSARVYEFEARTNRDTQRFRKTWPMHLHEIWQFRATAVDGKLTVDFVPTAGDGKWVVNGLLIQTEALARTPAGKRTRRRWHELVYTAPPAIMDGIDPDWQWVFAATQLNPTVPFNYNWPFTKAPPATPTAAEKARGFILYSRTTKHPLHPVIVPRGDERIDRLQAVGSRTEPVQLTFSLWGIRDLYHVRAVLDELRGPDGATIDPSAVRIRSIFPRTNTVSFESARDWDAILMPPHELDIDARHTQQYLVTADIPADAASGTYAGTIVITEDSHELHRLPIELQVTPFDLAPSDFLFVLSASDRWDEYGGDSDAVRDLVRMGKRASFGSLSGHGSTTIEFGGSIGNAKGNGTLEPKLDGIRQRIHDFRDAGGVCDFAFVDIGWGTSQAMLRAWAPEEAPKHKGKRIQKVIQLTDRFKTEFPKWLRKVDDCIRAEGIRRVVYSIHDEPHSEPETSFVRDVGILIRQHTESEVYVNTMNGQYMQYLAAAEALDGAPVATMWWTYGGISEAQKETLFKRGVRFLGSIGGRQSEREGMGFLAWRRRQYGGIDWTFGSYYGSAASNSDGPDWGGDASQIIPSVPPIDRYRWELIQQGVYDFRYIRTLEQAIAAAKASGDARKMAAAGNAQAMLDGYWQQIDTLSRNMGNVDPIIARREIIKAITQLQ